MSLSKRHSCLGGYGSNCIGHDRVFQAKAVVLGYLSMMEEEQLGKRSDGAMAICGLLGGSKTRVAHWAAGILHRTNKKRMESCF